MDRRSFLCLTATVPTVSVVVIDDASAKFTPITPCGEFIANNKYQVMHETVRIFNPDDPDQYIDVQRVRVLKRFTHEIDLTVK